MTANTLKITFKQRDDHRDAARDRLRRAEAGESGKAIVSQRPESIRQAAAAVDREVIEI